MSARIEWSLVGTCRARGAQIGAAVLDDLAAWPVIKPAATPKQALTVAHVKIQ
jgi:hypothetical protein